MSFENALCSHILVKDYTLERWPGFWKWAALESF